MSLLRSLVHQAAVHARCAVADLLESRERREGGWPKALMRFRVHGAPDLSSYRRVAEQCARDVVKGVEKAGDDPRKLRNVLDFGAGSGRTLRFLKPMLSEAKFTACDVDSDAVAWAKAHDAGTRWEQTKELPPLPFQDGEFDLVYAISVFTHLDEQRQFAWLDELRRVVRPGGLLLLTVQGGGKGEGIEELGDTWRGFHPGWYRDTAHSQEYVEKHFSRGLTLLAMLPKAMNDHQDVVLLRRPR